jgi:hypothetical protein
VVVHGIADLFWHWPVLAYIVAHGSPPGRLVMTTMLLQAGVADTTKCRLGDVDRSGMMVRLLESHDVSKNKGRAQENGFMHEQVDVIWLGVDRIFMEGLIWRVRGAHYEATAAMLIP